MDVLITGTQHRLQTRQPMLTMKHGWDIRATIRTGGNIGELYCCLCSPEDNTQSQYTAFLLPRNHGGRNKDQRSAYVLLGLQGHFPRLCFLSTFALLQCLVSQKREGAGAGAAEQNHAGSGRRPSHTFSFPGTSWHHLHESAILPALMLSSAWPHWPRPCWE